GLVNSYLQAGKINEAGFVAKEAAKVMPKDARTVLLNGNVWERITTNGVDNKAKAKKAYELALSLDPFYLDATLALAGLHLTNKDFEECIQLL
ncbi:unnamed protein product, partial [Choristocarpus tenellus]